jgi:LytR cell envelope-related transcriptional attenuator
MTGAQQRGGAAQSTATAAKDAVARTVDAMNPRPARVRPYQRRRRGPVVVVVGLLAVLAIGTWATVLSTASDGSVRASCPPPVGGAAPGETVERATLYAVPPAPASAVRVLVRNAGGQRGQANLVAAELGDLGIVEAAPPDNDPVYPDGDLQCAGQLRFGPAGEPAASTLSLVLPCVELIRDSRQDESLDLAVGTAFGDLAPSKAARDALSQLGDTGGGSTGATNADPAAADAAPVAPTVDPALLTKVREGIC